MTPWYRFFDWFRRSWRGNCDKIEPQSCSGSKGGKILIARAENDAALADVQGKSQNSSGNKGKHSYCQSRNWLMVMCMRVLLAICLAKTRRHRNCFRYTWRPGIVFKFDWFRRSCRGNCDKIEPQSCCSNKGGKILIARAENDAPLADLQSKSQSSSGNKGGKNLIARAEMDWW